ncbi:MAG: MoxR family ATPase, partial [Bacteroidales bacterium]|nr:MoxR family ATPase [Bacteroidales bacterium]
QLDRFMFNINVGYPSLDDEIRIVKNTTADKNFEIKQILSAEEIIYFQNLIRKIPINDNVLEYAVRLVNKTRPDSEIAPEITRKFIHWGAGPRASQYLVIGAKTVAVLGGKYSPDIEDVQAVAKIVLRHRVVKNYKAEAEGLSIEDIIDELVKD